MMLIIHVEDDLDSQDALARMFRSRQLEVASFTNAIEALKYITNVEPDVMLIDYKLGEGPNGLKLAEHVRQQYPACVIIMVSVFADFDKAVEAMQIGADDFIKKPISAHIIDRIWDAVMRRQHWFPRPLPRQEISGLVIDKSKRTVLWHDKPLKLTNAEFQLLALLISKPGHIFGFSDLYAAARGERLSQEEARNLLKPHIRNLRNKLSQGGIYLDSIINLRGHGYKWELNEERPDQNGEL
jgi:DNA-binding response OmpR family regulator